MLAKDEEEQTAEKVQKAIDESKGDEKALKENLTKALSDKKKDSKALSERISKKIEETKGDTKALKEKMSDVLQSSKDGLDKLKDKAARKFEDMKDNASAAPDSEESEKAKYMYVEYIDLMRTPKQYEGKDIVSYGRVISIDADNRSLTCIVEVSPWNMAIVTIPKSSIEMNIMEDDYITIYGKYKGVTSQVTKWDLGLIFLGVFSEETSYYNEAMPYIKAKYVDIVSW